VKVQHALALLVLPLLMGGACESDFDSYNDVKGLRILAMAADKPDVLPGESTTLSALVSEAADYSWSWCPLSTGSNTGYECAITHAEVQQFADELFGQAVVVPSYDLGSGETAVFPHEIPPLFFRTICELLLSADIPDGFDVPECGERFELQVKLTVNSGGSTVTAVRSLVLLLDADAIPNQNPVLAGISATEPGMAAVELDAAAPTAMKRGVPYEMQLDISEDSAEDYFGVRPGGFEPEDNQESLVATWFHQGGDLDKEHSSFLPGTIAIEVLRENEWAPPSTEDRPENTAHFYVVIRDGRGGTTWQEREIDLVAP
jgi:hypothetical protein